jgi:replication factor C subunit 2/4
MSTVNSDLPWIEKYRPSKLDDIVGNVEAINKLKVLLENNNIPNLIISGPPGSGKTSSIYCMANYVLKSATKDALLELNASDERGIDTVRKSIKMFCKKQVPLPEHAFKLVLLDEADNMTPSAQQALRRIIENYSHTTRFMFACNSSSRIIEAIQSRCVTIRFTKLENDQITKRLTEIFTTEKVNYTPEGIDALQFISDGDMRQILNNAQAIACNYDCISKENVYSICDKPHPEEMKKVLMCCLQGDHIGAQTATIKLHLEGYSTVDMLDTLFKVIKTSEMSMDLQMKYTKYIGFAHTNVTKGIDTLLQFNALIAKFCLLASTVNSVTL